MASKTLSFDYAEEDGFEIERDGITYFVTGTCKAEYTWSYLPATREEPEEDSFEQESFECEIGNIFNEDNKIITDIVLTEEEKESFRNYMEGRVEDVARESDKWSDSDYYDYERDDWPEED